MRIVVCVKQVPDTSEVKIDPETGTLIREGVPSIVNPFDQFALEEGVRIREIAGKGEVAAISMGPSQARSALMKCLALGADRAILLCDEAFAGSDTLATSYALSLAVKGLGSFDLILCGQQAIDGDTGQVGPELAQHLMIPHLTYVERVSVEGRHVTAQKQTDEGYEILKVKMPALLALVTPSDFVPGNPPFSKIVGAKSKPFETWGADRLGGSRERFGLRGSPTQVQRVFSPPRRERGTILEAPPSEAAEKLTRLLLEENLL